MYDIRVDEDIDVSEYINIYNLKLLDIILQKKVIKIVIIMENNEKILKKFIRKLIRYRKLLIKFNSCMICIKNYEDNNLEQDFIKLVEAIFLIDKRKIYEKAYDIACDYLDSQFYGKNLCDFCNNKCGYKKDTDLEIGCCRHYSKHKQFGAMFREKLVPCEYLGEDGICKIRCMGCKLFTCEYLEKKGIKFKTNEILAIDSIFNIRQKILLKAIVYTPKDKIIDKLMLLS